MFPASGLILAGLAGGAGLGQAKSALARSGLARSGLAGQARSGLAGQARSGLARERLARPFLSKVQNRRGDVGDEGDYKAYFGLDRSGW